MFIYNGRAKASKIRGAAALAKFMGAENAAEAQAAWKNAHQSFMSTPITEGNVQSREALANNVVKHFTTWANRYRTSMTEAFIAGEDAKAATLRTSHSEILEDLTMAEAMAAKITAYRASVQEAEDAALEATRPSDELIASLGYDLDDYGKEGFLDYGEDWFYLPGATELYGDEACSAPICPVCGCSGVSWSDGCGCSDKNCGCDQD